MRAHKSKAADASQTSWGIEQQGASCRHNFIGAAQGGNAPQALSRANECKGYAPCVPLRNATVSTDHCSPCAADMS